MKQTRKQVAVLGGGIMGSTLALFLSRRGFDVTIFDRENRPIDRTSRWNEGKIHLGYLYGADPTLQTARHILPGGLRFAPIMSDLLEIDVTSHATEADDYYMIHRDSLVDAETLAARFDAVSALIRDDPCANQYFIDLTSARSSRLSESELEGVANTENIVAGLKVPERSVNTQWVADRICEALKSNSRITVRTNTEVTYARAKDSAEGDWCVGLGPDGEAVFDIVINALWNGRIEIDLTAGLTPEYKWSNRYRLALFVRTKVPLSLHSAIVVVGAFGDIKNYNGREFYLSWYPAGLVQQDQAVAPTDPRPIAGKKKAELISEVNAGLTTAFPDVGSVIENAKEIIVDGGFVFAQGQGSISDLSSTLHRRDRFGTRRLGNYFSIDTGKYSTAPWMADKLARTISGE